MTKAELLQKAKPILFNTEMIQAILDGKKTVTRRMVKNVEIEINNNYIYIHELNRQGERINNVNCGFPYSDKEITEFMNMNYAPYEIGDILYVRETFQRLDSLLAMDLSAGEYAYVYKASDNGKAWEENIENWTWKPSIHMPKEAARIFLKVIDVRIERLQNITCEQIGKEGVSSTTFWTPKKLKNRPFEEKWWDDCYFWANYAQMVFKKLWNSTIKKQNLDRYGWDANPWVWAIEFEKVRNNDRRKSI